MRIIAGKYRRRKLLANPGLTTRPISAFVKESLFEHLNPELPGKRVADIFAGTGTIGFEALSRGAASCVFFEWDHRAFGLLQENVKTLKVEDCTLCWHVDVMRTSFKPKNVPHLLPFNMIFFDPPYKMVAGIDPGRPLYKSLERLARPDVSSDDAQLLFRTPHHATFQFPDVWTPYRVLDFNNMTVHWLLKNPLLAQPAHDRASEGSTDDAIEDAPPEAPTDPV